MTQKRLLAHEHQNMTQKRVLSDEERMPQNDQEWEVVAVQMMREILYANGGVNRYNPEPTEWPAKHTKSIANAAKQFFTAHLEFLTDDDIEQMCDGEEGETDTKYGIYPEWAALSQSLEDYFNR